MRWMLVLVVTMLLSSYAFCQDVDSPESAGIQLAKNAEFLTDSAQQEIVDANIAFADAANREKAEIVAKRKREARLLHAPLRTAPDDVQTHRYMNMRVAFPPDPSDEFFTTFWKLEGLSHDRAKYAEFERAYFQPTVQKLQQYAAARIPADATEPQRNKLHAAALVDIHRAATDFRISFPNLPARFRVKAGGVSEIFGPSSLFEKVLRQQGLLDQ